MTEVEERTLPPRPVTPTTIIAAELVDLYAELDAWGGAPASLLDRMRRVRDLADGIDPYVDRCTTGESAALARLARRTRETDWSSGALEQEMLSGHVEGRALNFLIRMSGARRVLEVGMFTGYSALAMAEALPEGGTVTACEIDSGVVDFARTCFDESPVGHRITVEVGPALETMHRLASDPDAAPFDFVFIDADKAGYTGYLELLLDSALLGENAVIAVDNTLMQGQPYTGAGVTANGAAISAFNAAVADDPRLEQVLLPLRDGLTLIRRATS